MRISIDAARCQGHGRCYDLAPAIFTADEEGYGQVGAEGAVPVGAERAARLAEANCPEQAITVVDGSQDDA